MALLTLALAAAFAAHAQTPAPSSRELVLTVGKSLVVNSAATIERVAVGFGDIAEARAVGPKEVLIDGKAPGETSLIIWQEGGNKLFFDVIVRANTSALRSRVETVRQRIQDQLSGQNIAVNFENDTVFLTGNAKDVTSSERAAAIAASLGKVVNLLYVDVPAADAQILLKVKFASVDRNTSSELGMNLLSTGATNTIGRVTTGQFSPPNVVVPTPQQPITVTLSDALNFFLFRPDLNLGATIRALQTRGLFEILAEPNVLAINGKQASFLAGGEFPYPVLQSGTNIGAVTIAFKEFGVRINFLPVITPRGTIRLDVAPEVSALDFGAGTTFQGVAVPGLTTRRVQTEIELSSGQSFAIGGLLDRRLQETMDKVPLLANIPLLGKIFQSKALTKNNNELLVIVTPEIVRPMPEKLAQPELTYPLPLDSYDTAAQTRHPGIDVTGPVPVSPSTPNMPIEKLLDSIKFQNSMQLKEGKDLTAYPGLIWAMPAVAAPGTTPPATTPPPQTPPK